MQDAPQKNKVGEYFRMSVKVSLSGGIPLARTRVTCNATQGLFLNSPLLSKISKANPDQVMTDIASNLINGTNPDFSNFDLFNFDFQKMIIGNLNLSKLNPCNLNIPSLNISSLNASKLSNLTSANNISFSNLTYSKLNFSDLQASDVQKLICFLIQPEGKKSNLNYLPLLVESQRQLALVQLSQGYLGVDSLGGLLKRNNVILDSNRTETYTDADGVAEFQLRFLAGTPGNYSIAFQAGNVISKASSPIILQNSIYRVNFWNSSGQTITYPFQVDSTNYYKPAFINFTVPPIIELRDALGQRFNGDIHHIQFHLLFSKDISYAAKVLNTTPSDNSWVDIQNANSATEDSNNPLLKLSNHTLLNNIGKMWLTLTSGVNILSYFHLTQDIASYSYSGITREDGLVYINVI